jgi:DNA topoisomerase I
MSRLRVTSDRPRRLDVPRAAPSRAKRPVDRIEQARSLLVPPSSPIELKHDGGDVVRAVQLLAHREDGEPTPKTHPRLFTPNGARLGASAPKGVKVEWRAKPGDQWAGKYIATIEGKKVTRHLWRATSPDGERLWRPIPAQVDHVEWGTPKGMSYVGRYLEEDGSYGYVFTEETIRKNQGTKFERVAAVEERYDELIDRLAHDVKGKDRKKAAVATAVMLIDLDYFRVGNPSSAAQGRYGVTTLEVRHAVELGEKSIVFDYVGKSNKHHRRTVHSPELAKAIGKLMKGKKKTDLLFSVSGKKVTAADVNAYLAPFGITAKDLRTYHATRLAALFLSHCSQTPAEKLPKVIERMYHVVAGRLGHTPKVCAEHYVSPTVVREYLREQLG